MRRLFLTATLFALAALPALAQTPSGPGPNGGSRFPPPPYHWMTIDSLSQALGLSGGAAPRCTRRRRGVMPRRGRRRAIRERMQASGMQFTPGQEPTPEMRARFDSVRTEMEGFQAEADQWYAAIRNNLTPAQQAKLDAMPKPMVFRSRGAMGPPGPPPQ
jgi:hypothetical protein